MIDTLTVFRSQYVFEQQRLSPFPCTTKVKAMKSNPTGHKKNVFKKSFVLLLNFFAIPYGT